MILFIHGEDTYRSHQKLLQLKKQFFDKYRNEAEQYEFDMDGDVAMSDIQNVLVSDGLFATKKLILLKRPFALPKEGQEKLKKGMEESSLSGSKDMIMILWDEKPDKRGKLFLYLKKNAKQNDEFPLLSGASLRSWIDTEVQAMGMNVTISTQSKNILIERIGSQSGLIHMTLEKLTVFALEEGRQTIEVDDVEALVAGRTQALIFDALDALGSGNKQQAMRLLHDQIEKGEHPIYLFTMLAYQVRSLLVITSLWEDGVRDPRVIAQEAKMAPFAVQKMLTQVRHHCVSKLKRSLQQLTRFDIAMKSGKIEPELALDEFIIKS